jgi:formylglycine-generating enzyme
MSNPRQNLREVASGAGLSAFGGSVDWLQGRWICALWLLCLFLCCGFSASGAPSVTNVSFTQQPGTRLVSVSYDLAGGTSSVSLLVSNDNGATYNVPVKSVTGAVGNGVTSGTGKQIIWDIGADWAGQSSSQIKVQVRAVNMTSEAGMTFAPIPGGTYQIGNLTGDSDIFSAGTVTVTLSPYYMAVHPTTKMQWDTMRSWATSKGYTDLASGGGKAADHPVQSVMWFDAVKWANAASEKEGMTPCYTVNGSVVRTGTSSAVVCDWSANGYRLPTEAEWEVAARGGLSGKRFPWGDTISLTQANYRGGDFGDAAKGYHPTYKVGAEPYTSPVGSFAANGYGLYDMCGNVWQWCWNRSGTYAGGQDPRGPGSGNLRVARGGAWSLFPPYVKLAYRYNEYPTIMYNIVGLRLARGQSFGTGSVASSGVGALDTTPPVLSVPAAVNAAATSASGVALTLGGASATDTFGTPTLTYSPASGSTFPIGTTTVTVTATDNFGNVATGTFSVTVSPPPPTVTGVTFSQRTDGSKLVDVRYTLTGGSAGIALAFSLDGGTTYSAVSSATGDVGTLVASGTAKQIVWNAGTDFPNASSANVRLRVTPLRSGAGGSFAPIPGGTYQMGNLVGDADITDAGTVSVTLSPFFISVNCTTKAHWDEVRTWAVANGYTDLVAGAGKATNHPVQMVSWYDVVKWANAASEREGLAPCYKGSGNVYRTGVSNTVTCDWSADGYRLPTEAEWEVAARGGLKGKRFPWGDTILQSQANYLASTRFPYDLSGQVNDYHPTYKVGGIPYSSPVGSFAVNGYGLYDMAGNVFQWCWDWHGTPYSGGLNPRGATSGTNRILRGGDWGFAGAGNTRTGHRGLNLPDSLDQYRGLRLARGRSDGSGSAAFSALGSLDTTPVQQIGPVSDVTFSQRTDGSKLVDIRYTLNGGTRGVALGVSLDGGTTFTSVKTLTGDVGAAVTAGTAKLITWNAGADYANLGAPGVKVRVTPLLDGAGGSFTPIPGGTFQMGNLTGDADITNAGTVSVTLSPYSMAVGPTTKAQWDAIRTWGAANGYTDLALGEGKAADHPVQRVSWYDALKWANAASEKEGLTPCYKVGGTVVRTGTSDTVSCDWSANGYRLPTEAEWEVAARGGLSGKRFPWGDTISHSQANYKANPADAYDLSASVNDHHPAHKSGLAPYTNAAGSFAANGYGLYDMAGNVWQWCWDRFEAPYAGGVDPRGGTTGSFRVFRGGLWYYNASMARSAGRYGDQPAFGNNSLGFRLVRGRALGSADWAESVLGAVDTVPPVLSVGGTVSVTAMSASGAAVTLSGASATDNLGTPVLTYSPASGSIFPVGTTTVTVTATDSVGNKTTSTFKVTVAPPAANIIGAGGILALIPGGTYQMGNLIGDSSITDAGTVTVTLSPYYMAVHSTTKAQWDMVRTWAATNGYTDLAAGGGKAANHPVHTVKWYDVVKWANAASEQEGLTPCYKVGGTVVRTGTSDAVTCDWSANGYRLPTEAEWEVAARGGLSGKRFPWGDTISHSQANYRASTMFAYDLSGSVNDYHPTYKTGAIPYTSPVGSFAANGYGLYDMAGNVWHWCWDWYGKPYAGGTDPTGVSTGSRRVLRGGDWTYFANVQGAYRHTDPPSSAVNNSGFRLARGRL